jgi:hypothetical protein
MELASAELVGYNGKVGGDRGLYQCETPRRADRPTRYRKRPRRLARPRTSPFHGGNTGSNPVGDANILKNLW